MRGICTVCPVSFAVNVASLLFDVSRGGVALKMNDPSIRQRSGAMPSLLLLLWHVAAIACMALLLPELKFQIPLWVLKPDELGVLEIVLGAYGVCALVSVGYVLLG